LERLYRLTLQTVAAAVAIQVTADPHPVTAANPGIPENFSGTLAVLNNDIDAGGPPGGLGIGVLMFSVGRSPDKEVDIYVSGNKIRNVCGAVRDSSKLNPGEQLARLERSYWLPVVAR